MVDLSPSGARSAVVAVVGESRELLVMDLATRKLVSRTPVDETKVREIRFAGEDLVMITVSGTFNLGHGSRYELAQVAVLDLKAAKVNWVFHRPMGEVMNAVFGEYGLFENEGRWIGYFGGYTLSPNGDPVSTYPDVWRFDLESGRHRKAFDGDPDRPDWLLDPGGKVLVSSEYDETSRKWVIYRGRDRRAVLAEGRSDLGAATLSGFGRSADTFAFWRDREADGVRELVEMPIAGGRQHPWAIRRDRPPALCATPPRD